MLYTSPSGMSYALYKDMLAQPHLLIAGATGSGKSVAENALMYTALYRFPGNDADSVKFILIDPKRVELKKYKHLPHTMFYASEPDEMMQALQLAMDEVERRYIKLDAEDLEKWPGGDVYVVIDEFADLVCTNKKVIPLVQRIAQIGRAAKVHLILCTQCPIADVIPTKIKVNFDARLGLRTSCAQDSRNIIRVRGCEELPRYGSGYYMRPEGLTRYQIPMISKDDLLERVKWWTDQVKAPSAPSAFPANSYVHPFKPVRWFLHRLAYGN